MKNVSTKLCRRGIGLIAALGFFPVIISNLTAAVTVSFESGFNINDTTFNADGGSFTFDNHLVITRFDGFGSGGGNWFVDSGFGVARSGSVGSLNITSANLAFYVTSLDLWTSNDRGNTNATGQVTLIGKRPDLTTISTTILVQPTGFSGNDWDTSNNILAFSNVPLISLDFQIGSGLNYIAVDRIALQTVVIPEPNTAALAIAAAALSLVYRRRDSNK